MGTAAVATEKEKVVRRPRGEGRSTPAVEVVPPVAEVLPPEPEPAAPTRVPQPRGVSAADRKAAGEALAAWMKAHGISDGALARRIGASPASVATWRKGSIPVGPFRDGLLRESGIDMTNRETWGGKVPEPEPEKPSKAKGASAAEVKDARSRVAALERRVEASNAGREKAERALREALVELGELRKDVLKVLDPAFVRHVGAAVLLLGSGSAEEVDARAASLAELGAAADVLRVAVAVARAAA